MKNIINPFELFSYQGPAYFCDREDEVTALQEAFDNRRNVVLYSNRRLGKTNLVQHWHHLLSKDKNVIPIYIDVLDTTSDESFINKTISSIFQKLQEKEIILNLIIDRFRSIRPLIGVDPSSGLPTVTVQIDSDQALKQSLDGIFSILLERNETIQLAFDEFQQISNYKHSRIDATIRSFYPSAHNVHFLYLGSESHLLQNLFTNPEKPMFSTAQLMQLNYIGYAPYFDFIKNMFEMYEKSISDNQIHEILLWTSRHTFYTHFLCNQIFGKTRDAVSDNIIIQAKNACLRQFETNFYYYRKILSTNQWKLLKSIAKEKEAQNIYGKKFLNKYNLSSSSTKQALDYLLKKQLVHERYKEDTNVFYLNDVFLSRWLENIE